MTRKKVYMYIISNPDEKNWRGIPSPFWNKISDIWQIELLLYRLSLIKPCHGIVISIPDGYSDARLIALSRKYDCRIEIGARSLADREREIVCSLNNNECALFFKVEHALIDYVELSKLLSELIINDWAEIQFNGFTPGTMPYRVVSSSGTNTKVIESNQLDRKRFGVEISDIDKIRSFAWIAQKLGSRILTITIDELSSFLRANRFKVLFFGEELEYEFVDQCDLCGGKLQTLSCSNTLPINSFVPQDISYYSKCENCGLVHLNPRPVVHDLKRLYNSTYAEDRLAKADLSKHKNWQWVIRQLPIDRTFSLLDVGGNGGEFGDFLDKNKCNYHLTDINPTACALANTRGVAAFPGRLDEIHFPEQYDFITMFELLEHLPLVDIRKYLYKAASLVKPGGSIFISTPNHDNILNHEFGLTYAEIPYHYYLFSFSTLNAIIETTIKNKEIIKEFCDTIGLIGWKEYWLRFALGKNKRERAKFICPDTRFIGDHLLIEIKL